MKSNRRPIWLTATIVGLIVLLWALYVIADPEKRNLDSVARAATPGAFAMLSDGYTHYELGGPASEEGRLVVLAAGFSVPYYIWDPTFNALTTAGFRVLRYDYYGRGYSDRPSIPFNDEMYVRQLDELFGAGSDLSIDDLARFAAELECGGALVAVLARRRVAERAILVLIRCGGRTELHWVTGRAAPPGHGRSPLLHLTSRGT